MTDYRAFFCRRQESSACARLGLRTHEKHYASNNTGRTDRDGPTPRHGGAAGRRHADHP